MPKHYAKDTGEMKSAALHKLSNSYKSVFKDDMALKYTDYENVLMHLRGKRHFRKRIHRDKLSVMDFDRLQYKEF